MTDPLKQALELKAKSGAAGTIRGRLLADGEGWRASDVICTAGPRDAAFEERHPGMAIAVVRSGTFSYRGVGGRVLLTPGALLLGNAQTSFCCGHEHGEGDRCLAFHFDPEVFERIAADAGVRKASFLTHCLPAARGTAPLIARAAQVMDEPAALEDIAFSLAAAALRANCPWKRVEWTARDERRVTEAVRLVEATFERPQTLTGLAHRARLSPFHFLRLFRKVTGASPHQFLLRTRLREAAWRLRTTVQTVTEVAYGVGFQDLSNFSRSFCAEYGLSPSRYRHVEKATQPEADGRCDL